jgi:hypothetical protein
VKRLLLAMTMTTGILGGMVTSAHAAPHRDPPCSFSASSVSVGGSYLVTASGLPTTTPINFFATSPDGTTTGYALGTTPTGTLNATGSSGAAGTWTYQFTGPTKNNFGGTVVYSSCSITVS